MWCGAGRRRGLAAFPALSCGVRRCPHPVGAAVALRTIAAAFHPLAAPSGFSGGDPHAAGPGGSVERVEFVLWDAAAWGTWVATARALGLVP